MFSKLNLWVLLVGLFLLSTAFFVQVRADEDDDYEDVDDDYEAENEEETGGDIDENDVVVLTDSNFNKIVEESKFALVSSIIILFIPKSFIIKSSGCLLSIFYSTYFDTCLSLVIHL